MSHGRNAGDGVACHGMMGVRRSRICPRHSRRSWRYGVLLWKLSRSEARCGLIASNWGSGNGDAVTFLIGDQNLKNRSAALACSVGAMSVRGQHGDQRLLGDEKSAEVGDVETFFDAGKLSNNFQERSRSVQRCTRYVER